MLAKMLPFLENHTELGNSKGNFNEYLESQGCFDGSLQWWNHHLQSSLCYAVATSSQANSLRLVQGHTKQAWINNKLIMLNTEIIGWFTLCCEHFPAWMLQSGSRKWRGSWQLLHKQCSGHSTETWVVFRMSRQKMSQQSAIHPMMPSTLCFFQ